MKLEIFHVDAFASGVFGGNPAAVVPLQQWLPEELMQAIATENNLSETAFVVPRGEEGDFEIRWFTPVSEVDLCGHATLAAAHVLFGDALRGSERVRFRTREAGVLDVLREGKKYVLDFPARRAKRVEDATLLAAVEEAMAMNVKELWKSRDLMAVVDSEQALRTARPDMTRLAAIDAFAVMITARGRDCDFVSRFFAPLLGIPDDPVTGSAHCTLIPYWADVLGKDELFARQVSPRGGELWCALRGRDGKAQRVHIAGEAVTYSTGSIDVPV